MQTVTNYIKTSCKPGHLIPSDEILPYTIVKDRGIIKLSTQLGVDMGRHKPC